MKIIYIEANEEYDALIFEEHFKVNLSVWNKLKKKGCVYHKDCGRIEGEALEFEEVDPAFIEFIKNKMIDYDYSKHTNFYIVEE